MNRNLALIFLFAAVAPLLVGAPKPIDDETRKRIEELFGPTINTTTTSTSTSTPTPTPTNRAGSNTTKQLLSDLNANLTKCVMEDDTTEGVCVLHYQCEPDNRTVITDGSTLIDLRQSKCPHYLQVCCKLDDVTNEKPTPPPVDENMKCGWSNPGADSFRINDGAYAEFGEFPWMVAILRKTDQNTAWSANDYVGGGSIIHASVVLTSAHKIDNFAADKIKCRAGEYDTQTDKEMYPHQERDVNKIVKHDDYDRTSVLNSVALLFLKSPYDLRAAPHMGVACVGRAPPPPATACLSAGWGKENFNGKDKYAVILKKVQLPMLARDACQRSLRRTRLGTAFRLHSSLTCAGGEAGRDTCTGDGGSPLVCPLPDADENESGRFAVFGLVAWGIGCGERGIPGVYVNVPEFYDWIGEKMRAEGYGTDSYKY